MSINNLFVLTCLRAGLVDQLSQDSQQQVEDSGENGHTAYKEDRQPSNQQQTNKRRCIACVSICIDIWLDKLKDYGYATYADVLSSKKPTHSPEPFSSK